MSEGIQGGGTDKTHVKWGNNSGTNLMVYPFTQLSISSLNRIFWAKVNALQMEHTCRYSQH